MIDLLDYQRPTSFDALWQALEAATKPVFVSAGCTDLIPKSRSGVIPPGTWLDLRRIPELQELEIKDDRVLLGACLTHDQISGSELIKKEFYSLAVACESIGSRQIRVLGTLGGNAANCSPCADSFLALSALDAQVTIRSSAGVRKIAAIDFPRGPGETNLKDGEIIESFELARNPARSSSFRKLGPRNAVAVAKVSVATSAEVRDGVLYNLRIVLGSVGPTVIRASEAEKILEGQIPDDGLMAKVREAVKKAVKPIDDVRSTAEYRRETSGVLAQRAVLDLLK